MGLIELAHDLGVIAELEQVALVIFQSSFG